MRKPCPKWFKPQFKIAVPPKAQTQTAYKSKGEIWQKCIISKRKSETNQPCFEGFEIDGPISNAKDERVLCSSGVNQSVLPHPRVYHSALLHFFPRLLSLHSSHSHSHSHSLLCRVDANLTLANSQAKLTFYFPP